MEAALAPDVDAVAGLTEQFVSPDLDTSEAATLRVDTTPQPSMLLASMLFRRGVIDRVGPFDVDLTHGTNIDWTSRARLAGMRTRVIPEVVHRRRVHGSNMGHADSRPDLLRIMGAHLRRHRDVGVAPGSHSRVG
jgi:GT2 family glycosyltransferase